MSAATAAEPQTDVGSPEAYAARLYERHSQAIFRLCLKHLRRREDADDALQTTFIYALLSLRRGVVPRMELPWLVTIACNVCSTRRRAGTRHRVHESPRDLDTIQDKLATPDHSDDASAEDFVVALRAIPETQRKALLLREWRGLSYDEIGSELGLSQPATEALLFRARKNVAQRLQQRISIKVLNGLPFLTFVRNLFRTGTAKLVTVAVGSTLTIASVPAADVGDARGPAPRASVGSTSYSGDAAAAAWNPVRRHLTPAPERAGSSPRYANPATPADDVALPPQTADAAITIAPRAPTPQVDAARPPTSAPPVGVLPPAAGDDLPLPVGAPSTSLPALPVPTPGIEAPTPLPLPVTVPDSSLPVPELPLPRGP